MTTLNISLPADLRAVVEERVASGRFATLSDYLSSLIREDQQRVTRDQLETILLERLDGHSIEMDAQDWKGIRDEFHDQMKSAPQRRRVVSKRKPRSQK